MMNRKLYVREDLKDFVPYKVENITKGIKLDANESPYSMDTIIKEEISKWLENYKNFNVYPDSSSTSLGETIAKYYGVGTEQVSCGVGSDQLIDCMIRGVIMPGDVVVYPTPSFSMYQSMITLNHGKGIPVELEEDFSYNTDEMIKACNENNAKLLILCTPNNPTGNSLSLQEIRNIAKQVNCLIMVDEAYGEFSKESAIDLIDEFESLVVLRTFSKAYGLAGLRVGYGIGSIQSIYPIEISKPPYNLNTVTQVVAQTVLENSEIYKKQIEEILYERDNLREALLKLGYNVYPSDTNFLLVECDHFDLAKYLETKEIYIRALNIRGKKMYRISVGTKEQNQVLLQWMREA